MHSGPAAGPPGAPGLGGVHLNWRLWSADRPSPTDLAGPYRVGTLYGNMGHIWYKIPLYKIPTGQGRSYTAHLQR